MQKARRHPLPYGCRAPTACRHGVSGSVSSPCRGSSHLSLALLYAIGRKRVFSLAGWSPRIRTHFHVLGRTQDAARPPTMSLTGLSPSAAGHSSPFNYHLGSTSRSYNPERASSSGLGSSAFARRYLRNRGFFLFLQVMRCFSSLGWLRVSGDQNSFDSFPRLIAVFHALVPSCAKTSPPRP
jgi:hypothetical protein